MVEIQSVVPRRHMLAARYTVNFHLRVELEIIEQFRRDQEVLAGTLAAGDINHTLMYHPFIARVHALVDFIYDTEGRSRKVLKRH